MFHTDWDVVLSFFMRVSHRLGWSGLVTHPFWQGALQHLAKDLQTDADIVSIRESVRQSIANFSVRASTTSELPKGNSVLGQVHGVHIDTQRDEGTDTLGVTERSGEHKIFHREVRGAYSNSLKS